MPLSYILTSGLTLAEFAARRGTSTKAARAEYGRALRDGEGIDLPAPTKILRDGDLVKFCLPHAGGEIESVLIPMDGYRGNRWRTLCVSSQIGCRMACTFCETGRMGLLADLDAAAIVAQRLAARAFVSPTPRRGGGWRFDDDGIRNVVFMGMGEPFDNFEAVAQSIRVLTDPAGLGIPMSRITVSTVGRVDGIRKIAAMGWNKLRLAISLNASDDSTRESIMPVNRGTPMKELRRALLDFPLPKGGRFLVEYVLLKGINDALADADRVAKWCEGVPCTVNLIPYNPQREPTYAAPDEPTQRAFLGRLKELGCFAKRRVTRGLDPMGACGQLGNPPSRR